MTMESYDFSWIETLADIGGGNGQMLVSLLQEYPRMKGILFDLPYITSSAQLCLVEAGLSSQVDVRAGDFFQEVPPGGDAYMLKHILHDWEDDKAVAILRNVRAVMPEHGRLLVVASVVTEDDEPDFGKLADIEMMTIPGGRERTKKEYDALFLDAGFSLSKIAGCGLCSQVLEAFPE
jgi:cyclopropane fatty-acyl-phospholipid synthase-like methyltransferase